MAKINLILCLMLFILSGCDDNNVPISADDFGYPKVLVSASGLNITGTEDNQLSQWQETGYKYSGDPLTVMVYNDGNGAVSKWCAWFGDNEANITATMQSLSLCNIAPPATTDTSVKFNDPSQPPCIFSKGQGLYLLLTNPSSDVRDPNSSVAVNRAPSKPPANFATIGLWQNIPLYSNNALAGGYYGDFPNSSTYVNGRAYFKILDKYYDDNSGAYYLALKRGFNRIATPPIAYSIDIMVTKLNDTAKSLFESIVTNDEYLTSMRAVIMLYIIISGILYLGGMLHMSEKELINMLIKLVIVLQLLTAKSSWQFFDEYFFQFFTSGLIDILNIVTSTFTGNTSTAGTVGTLTFFDQFLSLLFSYETNIKILAVITSIPSGFITALMIYVAFAIFTIAIIQAVILYLLCMIAISLLIMLGPIFIPMLLFKTTRSLFENWINQFANYFFQPILVFACIALFGQMIVAKIYQLLGFGACYNKYISFNVNGSSFTLLKIWQICPFSMNGLKDNIAIPGFGFWTDDPNKFCEPYECLGERYIDLPFLDLVKDASLIKAFEDPWNNLNMPMLYNAAILLLICYLMTKINDLIPDIAKSIAGTSSSLNVGGGNALKKAARVILHPVYSRLSKVLTLAPTARSQRINETIAGYSRAVTENKYFKAGKAISRYVIPPLSMRIDSKEEMQNAAWQQKAYEDQASGKYDHTIYNQAKKYTTQAVNYIQDTVGGTIENKYANLRGRPTKDELQTRNIPVNQDYNAMRQANPNLPQAQAGNSNANAPINPNDSGAVARGRIVAQGKVIRREDVAPDAIIARGYIPDEQHIAPVDIVQHNRGVAEVAEEYRQAYLADSNAFLLNILEQRPNYMESNAPEDEAFRQLLINKTRDDVDFAAKLRDAEVEVRRRRGGV